MNTKLNTMSALVLGAFFLTLPAGVYAADHFVSVDGATGGNNYNNDAAAPGTKNIAVGENARITGSFSNAVVVGYDAEAANHNTTALGPGAKAIGWRSVAVGSGAEGLDTGTTAVGDNARAKAVSATSIGVSSEATEISSTAVGHGSWAQKDHSSAFGYRAVASGRFASTLGAETDASGASSLALGYAAKSSGHSSMASGYEAKAIGNYSSALGYQANASGESSAASGFKAAAAGQHASAFGSQANASAAHASALGYNAVADIAGGVALGANSKTSANAGAAGYDPLGRGQTAAAWQSTAAGVSVGDAAGGITRQINNVAAGTADSDAANVAQLKALEDKLGAGQNASFGQLDGRIRDVGKRADAAAASAIAVGFSTVSQSENWVFKGNVSANSKGRFGAGAGALYQW